MIHSPSRCGHVATEISKDTMSPLQNSNGTQALPGLRRTTRGLYRRSTSGIGEFHLLPWWGMGMMNRDAGPIRLWKPTLASLPSFAPKGGWRYRDVSSFANLFWLTG